MTNHLGNVLTTVSDRKIPHSTNNTTIDYYNADISSTNDYGVWGDLLPQRHFSSSAYKFGFNGKEKLDELHGNTGDAYDYGMRLLDARLGRWLSPEPLFKEFPYLSSYAAFNNSPIFFKDPNGKYSSGDHTTSKGDFLRVFKDWEVAAEKTYEFQYLNSIYGEGARAKLYVIDEDYRNPNQKINEVGEGNNKIAKFSYNKHLGKYVDLGGFPLDAVHFFKTANLATQYPEWVVKWQGKREEYQQADAENPKGRTSAFAPEDMISNYLGAYFGSDHRMGNANVGNELEKAFGEVETLFKTNDVKEGKFLTASRIKELRTMIQKYYGTDDFRNFQKDKAIYKTENIDKINKAATGDNLPLITPEQTK